MKRTGGRQRVAMGANMLMRLGAREPSLAPSERRVAALILDTPEAVLGMSITELALQAGVAEATVVRLAKRLGCAGFQELKIGIARSLRDHVETIYGEVQESDGAERFVPKVFQMTIRTLEATLEILDRDAVREATRAIQDAARVGCFGIGVSGLAARDLAHRLSKIGIRAEACADGHAQAVWASSASRGDVVVAFSHSGATQDVVEACRMARENGALIVGVTQEGSTPLSLLADWHLGASARETVFRSEAMAARIAHLVISDALFVGVALLRYDEASARLERAAQATARKRL